MNCYINKRFFAIICLVLMVFVCKSQSISVSSFKLLDSDLTANTAGTMEQDQNGEVAALIKVVTTQTAFSFDCGAMGVVKTLQKPSEIWVYVPRGVKKMTISHPQLGLLRDYFFPIPIEAARTYELVLVSGTVQTTVKQARTTQFVVFRLSPANAQVELDGTILETIDGVATKMMKMGTYDYRVQAPNYLPEAGKVTIDNPKNKKIVEIELKPNFSKVRVKVDNNAEIWVNGEKKGNGSWAGDLSKGTYEFEAKKDGHRSTIITKDIVVTKETQTIMLQAPSPIYGDAEINSKPAMADIYIDGKKYGQTPQVVSELVVGSHQIRISKNGFEDYLSTLNIKENEITSLTVQMVDNVNTSNSPAVPELKTQLDSLSYTIGLAQTKGLKDYLVSQLGIDSAYVDDFIKGLNEGAYAGDDKKKAAHNAGIQIGQQISNQMIKGINNELYGNSSAKTISKEAFIEGFVDGVLENTEIMNMDNATKTAKEKMAQIKRENSTGQ